MNSPSTQFTLLVTAPPYSSEGALTAYQFAEAILQKGHGIHSVFFYQDGIYNANHFQSPAQDEINMLQLWQHLARKHNIPLQVCVGASQRRGIHDANSIKVFNNQSESDKSNSSTRIESERFSESTNNPTHISTAQPQVTKEFTLIGLGQFILGMQSSSHLISFGQ